MKIEEYPSATNVEDTDLLVIETGAGTRKIEFNKIKQQFSTDVNLDDYYPIGALYFSFNSTSPATLFGGSWEQILNKYIRAANDTGTGGQDTVSLTVAQMPSHKHSIVSDTYGSSQGTSPRTYLGPNLNRDTVTYTESTGSGSAHTNMPSYQNVYVWKRIA